MRVHARNVACQHFKYILNHLKILTCHIPHEADTLEDGDAGASQGCGPPAIALKERVLDHKAVLAVGQAVFAIPDTMAVPMLFRNWQSV